MYAFENNSPLTFRIRLGDDYFNEYTVNSFSWRNGPNPSFLMVKFSFRNKLWLFMAKN